MLPEVARALGLRDPPGRPLPDRILTAVAERGPPDRRGQHGARPRRGSCARCAPRRVSAPATACHQPGAAAPARRARVPGGPAGAAHARRRRRPGTARRDAVDVDAVAPGARVPARLRGHLRQRCRARRDLHPSRRAPAGPRARDRPPQAVHRGRADVPTSAPDAAVDQRGPRRAGPASDVAGRADVEPRPPRPDGGAVRRLSVFVGGWTLEAAEQVGGVADVVETTASLVEESGRRHTPAGALPSSGCWRAFANSPPSGSTTRARPRRSAPSTPATTRRTRCGWKG